MKIHHNFISYPTNNQQPDKWKKHGSKQAVMEIAKTVTYIQKLLKLTAAY